MEHDHFNPSISKYCIDAAYHKLRRTKNYCVTFSTLMNLIFFCSKKMSVNFVFVYAAIQTIHNISRLLSNQVFI